MRLTPFYRRQELLDWAKRLQQIISMRGDSQGAAAIQATIDSFYGDKFRIAVMGKAKRGKSTLLNAMLGRKDDLLAPVNKLPASSAISRFSRSTPASTVVIFQSGETSHISFDQIREYVTEDCNPENVKGIVEVRICDEFETLEADVELIDTPGAASIHEYHDLLLHGFIPEADAIIFLVSARMPIDEDELALLARIRHADTKKLFFAVNRIDESEPEDIEDAVSHSRKILGKAGLNVQEILRISGKMAFEGNIRSSGVDRLFDRVSSHLATNKGKILVQRFVLNIQMACQPCLIGLATEIEYSQISRSDLEIKIESLKGEYEVARSLKGKLDLDFLRKWKAAIGHFELALPVVQDEVCDAIRERLDAQKLKSVRALQKELPGWINEEMEVRLQPHALEFESLIRSTCQEYLEQSEKLFTPKTVRVSKELKGGVSMASTVGGTATTFAGLATVNFIAPVTATLSSAIGTAASTILPALNFVAPEAAISVASVTGTSASLLSLAGPIGWTLIGIGLLTVSMSWRGSRLRQKGQLVDAAMAEISKMLQRFRTERVKAFEQMGDLVVEEVRARLENEAVQISQALKAALAKDDGGISVQRLLSTQSTIQELLANPPIVIES